MTNYIWKAKDRSGKPVIREILANTAAEAKSILVSDGYTDLELFQDDTMAAAIDQGKVTPETTYQDNGQIMIKGWPKPIRNSDGP